MLARSHALGLSRYLVHHRDVKKKKKNEIQERKGEGEIVRICILCMRVHMCVHVCVYGCTTFDVLQATC